MEARISKYIADSEPLLDLYKNNKRIISKFVSANFPKDAANKIAIWSLWYRMRNFNNKNIKNLTYKKIILLFKEISDANLTNKKEILEHIEEYTNKIDKGARIKRFEKVEDKKIEERKKNYYEISNKEKDYYRKYFSGLNDSLRDRIKILFMNDQIGKLIVDTGIKESEIDEIMGLSAKLARRFYDESDYSDYFLNRSQQHFWDSFNYEYWKKKGYTIGYIYIMSNKFMPGLVKVGKTDRSPDERAEELSRPEGVPGKFKIEYVRKTVLDYSLPYGGVDLQIEKIAHKQLGDSLLNTEHFKEFFGEKIDEDNCDLEESEFFVVPSTKFVILNVDESLDIFDKFLIGQQFQN